MLAIHRLQVVQECLKQHISKTQRGCSTESSPESSLHDVALSIIAEYLRRPEFKYTLPVFLSEACHSRHTSHPLTSKAFHEHLGVSDQSSLGRLLASYASEQPPEAAKGKPSAKPNPLVQVCC